MTPCRIGDRSGGIYTTRRSERIGEVAPHRPRIGRVGVPDWQQPPMRGWTLRGVVGQIIPRHRSHGNAQACRAAAMHWRAPRAHRHPSPLTRPRVVATDQLDFD